MRTPRMLITAGPTHEPLDAVRYLANRSSGRLGVALAAAAATRKLPTTLLLGPVTLAIPSNVAVARFGTAAELEQLLATAFDACDVFIMAAAVADYRPHSASTAKWTRRDERVTLELEPTPDLVARCAARKRRHQWIAGFALEAPDALAARAAEKLQRKQLDAIVANPLATLDSPQIAASVLTADGRQHTPPTGTTPQDKSAFAAWLVDWAVEQWRLNQRDTDDSA